MSFTGDLEHLPIVDVIQLLHATRKSGILAIQGRRGRSELAFRDGYIVSASHLNNSVRIGQVLIQRGAVTGEGLERALTVQEQAGSGRKPLVSTLVELGIVSEQAAYGGLQALIEMTLVEVLTWKTGTFSLEANPAPAADGYQYRPEVAGDIQVDTQGVLMDALRIFDEKVRDGEISIEEEEEITADDLGLADLDQLERTIPRVFTTIDDRGAENDNPVRRLNEVIAALSGPRSAPETALAVLRYVGELFPRAQTLVVRTGELIAEKGIGIRAAREAGATFTPAFRIPLTEASLLGRAVADGRPYCGPVDTALEGRLFPRIGAPAAKTVLLLPVQSFGQTVFLTYADFGGGKEKEAPLELLEMLAAEAGRALERGRKR